MNLLRQLLLVPILVVRRVAAGLLLAVPIAPWIAAFLVFDAGKGAHVPDDNEIFVHMLLAMGAAASAFVPALCASRWRFTRWYYGYVWRVAGRLGRGGSGST